MTECEGSCHPHSGNIQHVHVWYGAYDWGLFWYCEEAIKEDVRRGLTVQVEEQS